MENTVIEKIYRKHLLKILERNPELSSDIGLDYSTSNSVDKESVDTIIARLYNDKPSGITTTLIDPTNNQ